MSEVTTVQFQAPMLLVLLDSAEAAQALRVSVATVNRWVESGRLVPAKRVGPRRACVFTADEVDRAARTPWPRRKAEQ